MPGAVYIDLAAQAAGQHGFITQEEARRLGFKRMTLVRMAERGQLERRSHGVYRVPIVPEGPLDAYMEATLWPRGVDGVLSHETALALYELSDVNPDKIDITVPRWHRIRRKIPDAYRIHREDLATGDIASHEGIAIVAPAVAIRQCHAAHLGPALLGQAIDHGERNGRLTRRQADELRRQIEVPLGTGVRR
jgi:predicted transcriptional regulator of viral defense system